MARRFITDQRASEIPSFAALDPAARQGALNDAEAVYRFLRQNEAQSSKWTTENALRQWAATTGADDDRVNVAIEILVDSGRVLVVGASANMATTDAAPPGPEVPATDAPPAPEPPGPEAEQPPATGEAEVIPGATNGKDKKPRKADEPTEGEDADTEPGDSDSKNEKE
jgi:hypothetical protein